MLCRVKKQPACPRSLRRTRLISRREGTGTMFPCAGLVCALHPCKRKWKLSRHLEDLFPLELARYILILSQGREDPRQTQGLSRIPLLSARTTLFNAEMQFWGHVPNTAPINQGKSLSLSLSLLLNIFTYVYIYIHEYICISPTPCVCVYTIHTNTYMHTHAYHHDPRIASYLEACCNIKDFGVPSPDLMAVGLG